MVTGLTVTMILGIVVITALFILRLGTSASPDIPSELVLPDGATPEAITQGKDWFGVVTTDGRLLIFDAAGNLTQEIAITK